VFLGAVGSYYLAKTTGIFSYFGWGAKNSKDMGSSEIMEVRNIKKSLTVKTNLETARQVVNNPLVGQTVAAHKDKTVKFEKIKVEEFKDLSNEVREENVGMQRFSSRRSISIQNSIPDQNVILGLPFNLIIEGTSVFTLVDFFKSKFNIYRFI
jgi:hypothetical protein